MIVNMATLFARGVLRVSSFFGNLKPTDNKLGLQELQLRTISKFFFHLVHHTNYFIK